MNEVMGKRKDFFLKPSFCIHNGVVILSVSDSKVCIGMVEENSSVRERVERAVVSEGFEFECKVISKKDFTERIGEVFSSKKETVEEERDVQFDENEAQALLESLLMRGVSEDATDIHIDGNLVRFRVSGSLKDEFVLDDDARFALVQRIKLLSRMNVLEKRRGQDGSFVFKKTDGSEMYIRASSMPSLSFMGVGETESVVLRLLDPARLPLEIMNLGFGEKFERNVGRLSVLENGLILICGATGVGKSTTACALLNKINKESKSSKKIISIEDPPEYKVSGVTQICVNSGLDMSFSEILKRVFRQDPDVLFVGEVRDEETADVCLQAAMTGHLVIATLHADSRETAFMRMMNLGCDEGILKEVVKGIVVQKKSCGKYSASVYTGVCA